MNGRTWILIILMLFGTKAFFPCVLTADEKSDKERLRLHKEKLRREAFVKQVLALIADLEQAEESEKGKIQSDLIDCGSEAIPILEEINSEQRNADIEFVMAVLLLKTNDTALDTPRPEQPIDPIVFEANTTAVPPEVLEQPLPEFDEKEIEKYIQAKLILAKREYVRGNFQYAGRMLEALLILEPGNELKTEMKLLRIACEEAGIHDRYLKATVAIDKPDFDYGDRVYLTFVLKNISLRPVRLPATARGEDPDENNHTIANFSLQTFTYDWAGNELTSKAGQGFQFDEDIILEPGETWSKSLEIDTAFLLKNDQVLRVMKVSGYLRAPVPIEEEGEPAAYIVPRRITFPTARFRIFPVSRATDGKLKSFIDFMNFSDRPPLETLTIAINQGLPIEIFLASQLQNRESINDVVDLLVTTLDRVLLSNSEAKKLACMAGLARITGQRRQLNRDHWVEWWEQNKDHFNSHFVDADY